MNGGSFRGEVLVVAGDALLNAQAHLIEEDGFWGGFLRMRSTAGAELVMEAPPNKRFITFDTVNPYAFSPRRTTKESPVVRITGLTRVPKQVRTGSRAVLRDLPGQNKKTTE